MSNLQDKINEARNNNNELASDAINDIERQTYYLRTDFDRLTIDRSTRESRREAALKILERVRNGEVDKVDEDDIYHVHNNSDNNEELHNSGTVNQNSDDEKSTNNKTIVEEKEVDFDELNAIDRLKVISKLINNDDQDDDHSDETLKPEDLMVDKDEVFNNESTFDSSETNSEVLNDDESINQSSLAKNDQYNRNETSIEDENIDNKEEYDEEEKQPGFFKKMMNKLFGGN